MAAERVHGTVADFDAIVGLGHIAVDGGSSRLFHCIEIADGTRAIAVGARVTFEPVNRFGHDEAANIKPE